MGLITPERLWWWSTRLHRRGLRPLAAVLKGANFAVFHAVLPVECEIHEDVTLWHRGSGTVIHPNTTIGRRVKIGHNVTIAAGSEKPGSPFAVVVGDDVIIGAGALIKPKRGSALHLGDGAQVGAHAVVVTDVPPGYVAIPPRATLLPPKDQRDGSPDINGTSEQTGA